MRVIMRASQLALAVALAVAAYPPHVSRELREDTCRSLNVTTCIEWEYGPILKGRCTAWGETPWQTYRHTLSHGLYSVVFGAWVGCEWFVGNLTELRNDARDLGSTLTRTFMSTRVEFVTSGAGAKEG